MATGLRHKTYKHTIQPVRHARLRAQRDSVRHARDQRKGSEPGSCSGTARRHARRWESRSPSAPGEPSVQSVPMPGEEEEDLINLGVAAWRRRGHAVQWRRGAACHQSGGAACHQPPRPPLVAARPGRPPADSGTGLFTVCTVVIVGVGHLGRLRFLDSDGSPPPLPLPLPGWLPAFCPCVVEFKPDLERF